jgi:uncharacterized repeat protein (TIGR04138 family)
MFVLECLNVTLDGFRRRGLEGHISGKQLLEGIREFASDQFGYLAATVFREWGMKQTRCFGEVVFQLADAGFLSRQESDSLDDFNDGFSFEEAFEREFIPDQALRSISHKSRLA